MTSPQSCTRLATWLAAYNVGRSFKDVCVIPDGRAAVLLGGKKTGYRIRGSDLDAFLKRAEKEDQP